VTDTALDRSYRALLAVPSFRRILVGMTIARIAGSMVSVAVILFSLELYGSPAVTGLVTFASIFPGTVLSPIMGALLDRHGRTRLVILDYLVGGASLVLIGALDVAGLLPAWVLIVIVAISSITGPLSNAGLRSLFPVIVPRHLWERANAVDSNAFVVAQLLGPPLAGVFVQAVGGDLGLVLIGVLFAIAAVVTVGIPDPAMETQSTGRLMVDAWHGLVYTWRNATLRGLAICMSTLRLGSGVQAIVVPVILLERLHTGPAVVGLAWGVSAVAGLVAGLLFGRVSTLGRERPIMSLSLAATGLGLALLLPEPSIPLVFLAMIVTGFLNGPGEITMFTLRQRRTDLAWMGRAFAVSMAFNFAGYPIGTAIAGAVAEQSLTPAILFGVLTCFLAGILAWVLVPEHGPEHGRAAAPDSRAAPSMPALGTASIEAAPGGSPQNSRIAPAAAASAANDSSASSSLTDAGSDAITRRIPSSR
jgi:MFS family permease